jgi:sugar phosphate isomerase/epimerase
MRLGLEAGKDTFDLAVELGIRGVPISAGALVEKGVEAALAPLRARGLEVCQIGAFGYNPLSPDADALAAQTALLQQAIPLAPETGCAYVTINGGNRNPNSFGAYHPYNDTEAALDEVARALAPLLALAEPHGVVLTIEAYLKTAINSAERFLALQARVGSDRLRCNVDVTSLYDYRDLLDPRAKVEQTCSGLAGHYGLGHVKEIALQEGFHIQAGLAPLGQGPTDWAQVLRLMAPHLPDDSWLILEHVRSPEEGRASAAFLRAVADEVGVTLE